MFSKTVTDIAPNLEEGRDYINVVVEGFELI